MKKAITISSLLLGIVFLSGCSLSGKSVGNGAMKFVPKIESDVNTFGNTTGNIANRNFIAEQDGWIYFVSSNDNCGKISSADDFANKGGDKCASLYKVNIDGADKKELVSGFAVDNINVVDEWIYYTKRITDINGKHKFLLYKIRTDGTNEQELNTEEIFGKINVVGDRIYYMTRIYDGIQIQCSFYSMHTGSAEITEISLNQDITDFNVVNDWVFYTMIIGGDNQYDTPHQETFFYKMRTDGTEISKLAQLGNIGDKISGFQVVDNFVYFLTTSMDFNAITDNANDDFVNSPLNKVSLNKMGIDGNDKKILGSGGLDYIGNINVVGDWIYYQGKDVSGDFYKKEGGKMVRQRGDGVAGNLYKMHKDGTNVTKIGTSRLGGMNIFGDWIYFVDSDNFRINKISTDGTDKQSI